MSDDLTRRRSAARLVSDDVDDAVHIHRFAFFVPPSRFTYVARFEDDFGRIRERHGDLDHGILAARDAGQT